MNLSLQPFTTLLNYSHYPDLCTQWIIELSVRKQLLLVIGSLVENAKKQKRGMSYVINIDIGKYGTINWYISLRAQNYFKKSQYVYYLNQ